MTLTGLCDRTEHLTVSVSTTDRSVPTIGRSAPSTDRSVRPLTDLFRPLTDLFRPLTDLFRPLTDLLRPSVPQTLLSVLTVLSAVEARPQGAEPLFRFSPSPVYSYRFAGPQQTKEESRDALGNIQGSYSVTYPGNSGTLTYSYSHPAQPPAFRTLSDGPLGPAGTVISIGKVRHTLSHTLTYRHILSHIVTYSHIPSHTVTYRYIPLHTVACLQIPLHINTCRHSK